MLLCRKRQERCWFDIREGCYQEGSARTFFKGYHKDARGFLDFEDFLNVTIINYKQANVHLLGHIIAYMHIICIVLGKPSKIKTAKFMTSGKFQLPPTHPT